MLSYKEADSSLFVPVSSLPSLSSPQTLLKTEIIKNQLQIASISSQAPPSSPTSTSNALLNVLTSSRSSSGNLPSAGGGVGLGNSVGTTGTTRIPIQRNVQPAISTVTTPNLSSAGSSPGLSLVRCALIDLAGLMILLHSSLPFPLFLFSPFFLPSLSSLSFSFLPSLPSLPSLSLFFPLFPSFLSSLSFSFLPFLSPQSLRSLLPLLVLNLTSAKCTI